MEVLRNRCAEVFWGEVREDELGSVRESSTFLSAGRETPCTELRSGKKAGPRGGGVGWGGSAHFPPITSEKTVWKGEQVWALREGLVPGTQ